MISARIRSKLWWGGAALLISLQAPALGQELILQKPRQAAAKPGHRLVSLQGDVRWRQGLQKGTPFVPATAPLLLSRRDEIETGNGTAEVRTDRGMAIELAQDTLLAVIGADSGVDVFLARGALQLRSAAQRGNPSTQIVTAAGRLTARGKDVRVRIEGDRTLVMVHDGQASLWGQGAVILRSGQTAALIKGAAPTPPQPIQAPSATPAWLGGDALVLHGARPARVALRWQAVEGALGYRVELARVDAQAAPIVVESAAAELELPGVPVGIYAARVAARLDGGRTSPQSEPRRVVVLALLGLSPAGTLQAGTLPRLATPEGAAASLQVNGEPVRMTGLAPGAQKIQVQVGALLAETSIEVTPARVASPGVARRIAPAPAPAPAPSVRPAAPSPAAPPPAASPAARGPVYTIAAPPDPPVQGNLPPEDLLLSGRGEVPGGGVRSPWAGRLVLVQLGLETDEQGQGRLSLMGRAALPSGLGGEVSFAALRFFPDTGKGSGDLTHGNLALTLRSPALRRSRFALQGIVGATALLGPRPEDHAAAFTGGSPGGAGRDWLIDGALVLGLRLGRVALHTQQGVTLALDAGGSAPLYEGGMAIQAEATRSLRVIALSQWHAVAAGPQAGIAGGAVGGGLEIFLPGPLGGARIQALGRAGIGAQGAAVYGRGMFGVQLGYRIR